MGHEPMIQFETTDGKLINLPNNVIIEQEDTEEEPTSQKQVDMPEVEIYSTVSPNTSDLKKVYYTDASVISLAKPYVVEIDDQVLRIDIPHEEFDLIKSTCNRAHPIQELLFNKVKYILGHGGFYMIPSQIQVELDALWDARTYHPENFPMDSDESVGLGGMFREDS
jgi:hypothetical protein